VKRRREGEREIKKEKRDYLHKYLLIKKD